MDCPFRERQYILVFVIMTDVQKTDEQPEQEKLTENVAPGSAANHNTGIIKQCSNSNTLTTTSA